MLTAYVTLFRVSLGMHELMAAIAQQDKVLRVESQTGEVRPDSDVMDFVHLPASVVNIAASAASSSISCPDTSTHALPLKRGEEPLVLCGDSTLPSSVCSTAVCVISATSRTKSATDTRRGDELGLSATVADQTNFSALCI